MEKKGHNDFNKYQYLKEAQVTELFHELFVKHKVHFDHSVIEKSTIQVPGKSGSLQNFVTVEVSYAFIDVESGEKVVGTMPGQGLDSGDKAIYKAVTGAVKYIFMKRFNIPTGDEPEQESPEMGKKSQLQHHQESDEPFESKPKKQPKTNQTIPKF